MDISQEVDNLLAEIDRSSRSAANLTRLADNTMAQLNVMGDPFSAPLTYPSLAPAPTPEFGQRSGPGQITYTSSPAGLESASSSGGLWDTPTPARLYRGTLGVLGHDSGGSYGPVGSLLYNRDTATDFQEASSPHAAFCASSTVQARGRETRSPLFLPSPSFSSRFLAPMPPLGQLNSSFGQDFDLGVEPTSPPSRNSRNSNSSGRYVLPEPLSSPYRLGPAPDAGEAGTPRLRAIHMIPESPAGFRQARRANEPMRLPPPQTQQFGRMEPDTEEEYWGDDCWVAEALAKADKVEANSISKIPQNPPGRTESPYFQPCVEGLNQTTTTSNEVFRKANSATIIRPPSRRSTVSPASTISFPKLPLSRPSSRVTDSGPVLPPPTDNGHLRPARRADGRRPPNPTACRRNSSNHERPVAQNMLSSDVWHGGSENLVSARAWKAQAAVGKNGPLVSVNALDTLPERELFTFEYFNDMQSEVFQTAYNSDENIVVSAPTGSGKTTVFELALLQMIKEKTSNYMPLAIYMAPTKALCNERVQDWRNRLSPIEVRCIELTGDTDTGSIYRYLETVDLIVTTPEKWDSITRRLAMSKIIDRLRLMMIDEVHILNETRGSTLEVVVARMKTRGNNVRFVAVSASVPNIDDVARWIGTTNPLGNVDTTQTQNPLAHLPKAKVFKFGEEYRPVPLKRLTYGFDAPNDWALGAKLDKELFPILNRHSDGLPVLIFCPTRKACHTCAEYLVKEYQAAEIGRRPLPWDSDQNSALILRDPKIQALTECGIAIHHAGLDLLDRRAIETAFKESKLHLIVATSTLAVGVNLPAHLVVIKGTTMWQGQGLREYSDIDIQQMMGRAGRPQFDNSGTVVVMCMRSKVAKYTEVLNSRIMLESCLHENLTEHINSEIGLQTIVSLESAQQWLRNSFLFIRIQQNPRHYQSALVKGASQTWGETLDEYVENAVKNLEENDFVACDKPDNPDDAWRKEGLHHTACGKIMSQNCIMYTTMCNIVSMESNSSLRDLLEILAGSEEFSNERIRQGEAPVLNKLRVSDDLRYQLNENVKTYADKVFLYIQVALDNLDLQKYASKAAQVPSPLQSQIAIFNVAPRIARAILQVASERQYGGATRSALELVRSINGKAWEDSCTIFRQLDKIGAKSIAVLGANGVHSWSDFVKIDPGRLEMWLNRHSPFGHEIIEKAKELPRFQLQFSDEEVVRTNEDPRPLLKLRVTVNHTGLLVYSNTQTNKASRTTSTREMSYTLTILFLSSQDNRYLDLRKIDTRRLNPRTNEFVVELRMNSSEESVVVVSGVDEKAGLSTTYQYKPHIPASAFSDSSSGHCSESWDDRPLKFNGFPKPRSALALIFNTEPFSPHTYPREPGGMARPLASPKAQAKPTGAKPTQTPRRQTQLKYATAAEEDDIDDELIDLTVRGKRRTPRPESQLHEGTGRKRAAQEVDCSEQPAVKRQRMPVASPPVFNPQRRVSVSDQTVYPAEQFLHRPNGRDSRNDLAVDGSTRPSQLSSVVRAAVEDNPHNESQLHDTWTDFDRYFSDDFNGHTITYPSTSTPSILPYRKTSSLQLSATGVEAPNTSNPVQLTRTATETTPATTSAPVQNVESPSCADGGADEDFEEWALRELGF